MEISESNCPKGARVSVVTYSNTVNHLIRFSDFKKKNLLLDEIRKVLPEKTPGRRNIGEAMRFVGRNIFKRIRHGVLIRKVLVFFANGRSQDAVSINTAVLELGALNIVPAVIAFSDVPNVKTAFAADESGRFKLFVWKRLQDQRLEVISDCTLCYDKCIPDVECELDPIPPAEIDMDIVFILDSSRNIRSDFFLHAKDFVSSMLDHIVVSSQPTVEGTGARVALVQQANPSFLPNQNISPVKMEFDLVSYNDRNLMKRHIEEDVTQLGGPSSLGYSLQWTIENIFKKAPNARKHKVIFTILGSKTSFWDREKLKEISRKAKCEKFTLFILAFGKEISHSELNELSSLPQDQHALHLLAVAKPELTYAERFTQAFIHLLNNEINSYPGSAFQAECEGRGDSLISLAESTYYTEVEVESTEQMGEFAEREVEKYYYEEETESDIISETTETVSLSTETGVKTTGQGTSEGGTVLLSKDICQLKQKEGDCQDYVLKWWYNSDKNKCVQFWYGGCRGNKNQFETEEECETVCLSKS